MKAAEAKALATKIRKEQVEEEIADVLCTIEQEAEEGSFFTEVDSEQLTNEGATHLRTLGYVVSLDAEEVTWTISWE